MLCAADLVTKNRHLVSGELAFNDVIETLGETRHGFLYLVEGEAIKGVITASSIIRACRKSERADHLKAVDLVYCDLPVVSCSLAWKELVGILKKNEAVMVTDSSGTVVGAVTPSSVISRLSAKISELERELDAIINFSSDEIIVADGKGRVLRANALFEENFGVKLSDVLGKNVSELEKKKIFTPSVTRMVIDKKSAQTVIQSHRDGRKLLATGTPALNRDGSVFRVIVNTRDITRLNSLKHQLEEAELLKNRYQQELVELRQGYLNSGEIVASSPAMKELLKVAQKIAAVNSTVLLTGESGVGKGMIARFIHNTSPRAEKPFTTVNCGAIPETLLESELFGYAGGAFTGALREGKIGKLELANQGTLFLDEITELPLNLQVKLLHVIQEGIITRIGESKEIALDLRFIAATNRDIAQLVEEGKFREDLYFRLDVIPLLVPPLKERIEDIRALADQFLFKFNNRFQQEKYFTPEIYHYLEKYQWPGNVRELENLVERLMIVADGSEIGPAHLPRRITGIEPAETALKSAVSLQPLKEARENLEREMLKEALRVCRSTYEIAEKLQIDQSTVVRKLHKYKLAPDRFNESDNRSRP
jgi:PAS domain S-box-containing protein